MRLRPLTVCSVVLALLVTAPSVPAFAAEPVPATTATPAPTPAPAPASAPDPGPAGEPQPEAAETGEAETEQTGDAGAQEAEPEGTPGPGGAAEKLEDGLALDEGRVRAIVELTDPGQHAPVAAQAAEESVDVVLRPRTQPFMVVEGTAEELAALADDPRVTSIHRDRAYPPSLASSLTLIGADQAHARGFTGTGQAVAVLDTGIDRDHPAFAGRIVEEACFSAVEPGVESLCPNGQPTQTGAGAADAETAKCLAGGVNLCEHGSHVAGIAAGNGGVAPGAGIVAVQVFSRVNDEEICGEASCLLAYESSLRLAMEHVAGLQRPVAAVNLSLGGGLYDASCDDTEEGRAFRPAVEALLAKGTATVVAAGNEFHEGVAFPACLSSTVAVGANDDADAIADFSNRGPLLDLFAPGVDVESAVPDDAAAVHSGTSMAAPHVAGALALLRAQSPQAQVTELVDKLKAAGRPYAYEAGGAQVTTPRLDVLAALTGSAPQPGISQSPAPGGPGRDPEPDPSGSSGPAPTPDDPDGDPQPGDPGAGTPPSPVPLPTVTVTVTVTPKPAATVCTRGAVGKRLTAQKWAVEIHRSSGAIPDATLTCYLKLVQKASKVFPELTRASTLGTAYRTLKATGTARQRLDAALLVGWLNWAHGTNGTTKLTGAEKVRLSSKATTAALKRAARSL
ncbi:S8 family peptidase [Nonomuraea indica]|uniref:S8 family peptidase n=1 Tax=Nonomuraea indica TaxID=1581193 RepID=UPI0011840BA0|nr:S8 family serine peptidase [Nonomuraea indica]